ncbi:hypothetical protein UlMin_006159 [Ulmus minor]
MVESRRDFRRPQRWLKAVGIFASTMTPSSTWRCSRGDLATMRQMIGDIEAQMVGTLSEAKFDTEVAEVRVTIVNEMNELKETALFTVLLYYSTKEGIMTNNCSSFDPLRVSISNDSSMLEISRSNGKNALHLAARQGHVDIVRRLLEKDPQLASRTDKKGQTVLHMVGKGVNCQVVKLILNADAAIVMLPDNMLPLGKGEQRYLIFDFSCITNFKSKSHFINKKIIVNELLVLPDTNVNALTRDHKTALHIAECLTLSEETQEIRDCLSRYAAVRSIELNQPRGELRRTVTQIKKDVHIQQEQTRKTNKNVTAIAKELRKLHREGINNATNSATVVAVLLATVAFAAIFTLPEIFFLFNAIALFTSLAVVLVQITLRRVVEVINKLMWLASVCTTVAFISSAYIVLGRRNRWAAILVTVIGAVTMAGVLGTMTYYVVKNKRIRKVRKKEKNFRNGNHYFWRQSDSDSEVNPIYAI